ncbi:unnamed protein product, partial [Closterium sp. NIES-53]
MELDRIDAKARPKKNKSKCSFFGKPGHRLIDCDEMKTARSALRDHSSGADLTRILEDRG